MLRLTQILSLLLVCGATAVLAFDQDKDWNSAESIYAFHAKSLSGQDVNLADYKGRVLVIVNVASQCGLTHLNYEQLQKLHEEYEPKGLSILAFPSNQFLNQEPGNSTEIAAFVKNLGVTFDMFEKINVNDDDAHPLYKWLKSRPKGAGDILNMIKWNFTKFLIDRNGQVVNRYSPQTEPVKMTEDIKKELAINP